MAKAKIERASNKKIQNFCNKVRKAGGGNPLDALMPAVPQDSSRCLIARNLNFNCEVDTNDEGQWQMYVSDTETATKIAKALKLKVDYYNHIVLPPEIGQAAADFDELSTLVSQLNHSEMELEGKLWFQRDKKPTGKERANIQARIRRLKKKIRELDDLWPLIEESEREAYANASFVNDKGELVL